MLKGASIPGKIRLLLMRDCFPSIGTKVDSFGQQGKDGAAGCSCALFLVLHWDPLGSSQVVLVVKNLPANAGDARDVGSIPGSGRSPGGGHGNSLQYSCLENPMDRGAWRVTVHGVAQSQA